MKTITGDQLRQFLKRHGDLPPVKTYFHAGTMARWVVVKVGSGVFTYSEYEAKEYLRDEEMKKYTDKLDKKSKEIKEW